MVDVKRKLADLGLALPNAAAPAANYVPYVVSGKMLYISGQIPFINGEKKFIGCVGKDVSQVQAVAAARACALNILGQVNAAMNGDWSKVKRCVKLVGFVHCAPNFYDHPMVMNGASDLMVAVLGDAGKHARSAVGAPSLPLGVAVEVEAIFELN